MFLQEGAGQATKAYFIYPFVSRKISCHLPGDPGPDLAKVGRAVSVVILRSLNYILLRYG